MNRASIASAWDYTALATDYDARPDYSATLLTDLLGRFALNADDCVVDVGAGTGKLTAHLCAQPPSVIACEPNAAMRRFGVANPGCEAAVWIAADGHHLPMRTRSVDLLSYGSSFNVLDARLALGEAARVLKPGGYWLAVWNHRDLDDPLQRAVEAIVHRYLPAFDYGSRRRDPSAAIAASRAFDAARCESDDFLVRVETSDWLRAWRSHATLQRQAGAQFERIIADIGGLLGGDQTMEVPYCTRLWWAQRGENTP